MADFHFHGKVISRGAGRSAVGAAAYRSGEKLTNEKDGMTHDYTKKGGVVHTEIMLCENAPPEYQNREKLWNAVESIATSKERIARDFDVALPIELSRGEQIDLVRNFVNDNFVKAGMCADFAIHDKGDGNPHAHIMLTMRPIDETGKWEYVSQKLYICKDREGNTAELSASELKKAQAEGMTFEKQLPYFKNGKGKATYLTKYEAESDPKYKDYVRVKGKNDPLKTKVDRRNPTIEKWDSKESFNKWRESWAAYQNREFEKKNLSVRVDHRSYEARGINKIPTQHLGTSAKAMERSGKHSDRGNENREIKIANAQIAKSDYQIKQTQNEINSIRDNVVSPDREAVTKINDRLYAAYVKEYPEVNAQKLREVMNETTEKGNIYFIAKVDGQFKEKVVTLEEYRQAEREAVREQPQRTETRTQPAEPTKSQPPARAETVKEKEPPRMAQEPSQPTAAQERISFDTSSVARQLAMLRNELIRETISSHERTTYQPNLIHQQQAGQIESYAKAYNEQGATIAQLKAERDNLGWTKGKEKKAIQGKIDNFERLRQGNAEKLKSLGVSDPSRAEEVIGEKTRLAAAERYKAQAAKQNEGAGSRAAEAKAALFDLAKTVPADQQQAVRSQMRQYADSSPKGMAYIKANIETEKVLDEAFKDRAESKEHERTRTQSRERDDR